MAINTKKRLMQITPPVKSINESDEARLDVNEIHDRLEQCLAALKLLLAKARSEADSDVRSTLDEANNLVDEVTHEFEGLSFYFVPSKLNQDGLLATLVAHFNGITGKTGLLIHFKHSGLDREIPGNINFIAFRIVQYAVQTILQNGRSAELSVAARIYNRMLFIKVKSKNDCPALSEIPKHLNNINELKEKVSVLGGDFAVDLGKDETVIIAKLPIAPVNKMGSWIGQGEK